jgi:AcrR family transcriptional regulator
MARPREFDEEVVLDRAMEVFWRRGYDGASMAELTRTMGINSPSVYVAYGSKRGLFEKVLDRYQERRARQKEWMLEGKTAREVAERMLVGAAQWLTTPEEPRGCLLIQCGLSAGEGNGDIPQALATRRRRVEITLSERFEQAKNEGELAADTDAAALARYIQNVFSGMGIQAAAGASREELEDIVRRAMMGWPAA